MTTTSQIAILNLLGSRPLDEVSDRSLGAWAHLYDADVSAATIDGRIHAAVPVGATEEQIGAALRRAAEEQP